MKVIKGTNAGSVTNRKARNNGMEIILFQISSKSCVGSNFKFNRNKDRAKHVGREPWFRAKDRIASCIRSSIGDRSRFQNLSRICKEEGESEVAAFG